MSFQWNFRRLVKALQWAAIFALAIIMGQIDVTREFISLASANDDSNQAFRMAEILQSTIFERRSFEYELRRILEPEMPSDFRRRFALLEGLLDLSISGSSSQSIRTLVTTEQALNVPFRDHQSRDASFLYDLGFEKSTSEFTADFVKAVLLGKVLLDRRMVQELVAAFFPMDGASSEWRARALHKNTLPGRARLANSLWLKGATELRSILQVICRSSGPVQPWYFARFVSLLTPLLPLDAQSRRELVEKISEFKKLAGDVSMSGSNLEFAATLLRWIQLGGVSTHQMRFAESFQNTVLGVVPNTQTDQSLWRLLGSIERLQNHGENEVELARLLEPWVPWDAQSRYHILEATFSEPNDALMKLSFNGTPREFALRLAHEMRKGNFPTGISWNLRIVESLFRWHRTEVDESFFLTRSEEHTSLSSRLAPVERALKIINLGQKVPDRLWASTTSMLAHLLPLTPEGRYAWLSLLRWNHHEDLLRASYAESNYGLASKIMTRIAANDFVATPAFVERFLGSLERLHCGRFLH